MQFLKFPRFGRSKILMEMPWPRHDPDPVVERRKRLALFLALSVLIHAGVLMIELPNTRGEWFPRGQAQHQERLTVRLAQKAPKEEHPEPLPEAKPLPQLRPTPKPPPRPPVIATPQPTPEPQVAVQTPPPTPTPQPEVARPIDMMAMVNAARERRRLADAAIARENAAAAKAELGPSAEETALANLNRNLQTINSRRGASGGVFEVRHKGTRTAEILFNGWNLNTDARRHELLYVDAGDLGDVDLAIVRKMIEVIRKDYPGDFSWYSNRLGRAVILSARPADQKELETFLLRDDPVFGR